MWRAARVNKYPERSIASVTQIPKRIGSSRSKGSGVELGFEALTDSRTNTPVSVIIVRQPMLKIDIAMWRVARVNMYPERRIASVTQIPRRIGSRKTNATARHVTANNEAVLITTDEMTAHEKRMRPREWSIRTALIHPSIFHRSIVAIRSSRSLMRSISVACAPCWCSPYSSCMWERIQ